MSFKDRWKAERKKKRAVRTEKHKEIKHVIFLERARIPCTEQPVPTALQKELPLAYEFVLALLIGACIWRVFK